ncbi:copper resistance protein B [Tistrella mobilis]|uniref:copper resistance protein B n=1 Tax=Tistrella mobilis TaxID=171437 RepID=UPI0009DB134A|nr:copper resistance protein B [Tistrella mobilis]
MTTALILAAASALTLASPALAQHAGHGTPAADPHSGHAAPAAAQPAPPDPNCTPEHAAMGHCTPAAAAPVPPSPDPHAGHKMPGASQPTNSKPHAGHAMPQPAPAPGDHAGHRETAPALAADPHAGHATSGNAPASAPPVAPPPPEAFSGPEHAADTVFDPTFMAKKRAGELMAEHGGYTGYMVLFDRLEYRAVDGHDGYAWDGEAWYGGDYNRLWLKTEGEGAFGEAVESAEIQALYSRAIDPWFNLQAGVRYDIRPKPDRAHLVVGLQGLAPYWFEVDAAAFLSDEGHLTARLEAEYDQRITNRLILQPRVELDLAAQDVPELGIGAGLSSIEAGLRLRYEIEREFAPYVGVQYERRFGDTADFARAAGEDVGRWAFLFGIRSWF